MKKKLLLVALVLVFALALSACGCKHETWLDADCETPKTCAECSETEGAPLGHTWAAATCETPKTCETCGKTEGEALGHSWADATCETPKTCETCKLTEGEALGHSWMDATTEAPKTCETCGKTEGDRIVTDSRFTTAATQDIQGKWEFSFVMTGEMMELEDFTAEIDCILYMDLGNDGTVSMTFAAADPDAFEAALVQYMMDALYAELAASGLDQAAADAAMKQAYGMNVQEYAEYAVENMGISSIFDAMAISAVYYVEDSQLYMALSWDAEMSPTAFTLEGDTLTLEEDISGSGEEVTVFTRVAEAE